MTLQSEIRNPKSEIFAPQVSSRISDPVVVIGGGPAGLSTAIAAAESGASPVVLVERKRRWGWPVQCAGYVPQLLTKVLPIPPEAVANRIEMIRFYLDGAEIGALRAPGFILRREIFEEKLAHRARELGVDCWQPARLLGISNNEVEILACDMSAVFPTRVVVGADGPRSLVRRAMGLDANKVAAGIQQLLPLSQASTEAEVFFNPKYGAGYGWCFPRGEEAIVGLALDFEQRSCLVPWLAELVHMLARRGTIRNATSKKCSGGIIPIGGPSGETVRDHFVLVGNAAGQINPLTGAGVYTAMVCGRLAGETIGQAMNGENLRRLKEYEIAWRDLLSDHFSSASYQREKLRTCNPEKFISCLQDSWRVASSEGRPCVAAQ